MRALFLLIPALALAGAPRAPTVPMAPGVINPGHHNLNDNGVPRMPMPKKCGPKPHLVDDSCEEDESGG